MKEGFLKRKVDKMWLEKLVSLIFPLKTAAASMFRPLKQFSHIYIFSKVQKKGLGIVSGCHTLTCTKKN